MSKEMHNYDDIIHLPHHVSGKHPQMAMIDRAAQFSPFAALTGYDAAIQETGRLTDDFVELEEDDKAVLDQRLQYFLQHREEYPTVTVTYFCPDTRKTGGSYRQAVGQIKRVDVYRRVLILTDGTELPLDHICRLEESWESL